jgi:MarR family transcriptional repressor of emrRAB
MPRRRLINLLGAWTAAAAAGMWRSLGDEAALSASGAAALVTLWTFAWRDTSIRALAQVLSLSHSATVRLIDRLEAGSLVRRRPGADGREVLLSLTERGRAVAERLFAAREHVLDETVGPLSLEDAKALTELLETLLRRITGSRVEARWICRICDHGLCHRSGGCPVDDAARALGQ